MNRQRRRFSDGLGRCVCWQNISCRLRLILPHATFIYGVVVAESHAVPAGSREVRVAFRFISESTVLHIFEWNIHLNIRAIIKLAIEFQNLLVIVSYFLKTPEKSEVSLPESLQRSCSAYGFMYIYFKIIVYEGSKVHTVCMNIILGPY
jgi:hypothetical protein